jgi:hypothetical protein
MEATVQDIKKRKKQKNFWKILKIFEKRKFAIGS